MSKVPSPKSQVPSEARPRSHNRSQVPQQVPQILATLLLSAVSLSFAQEPRVIDAATVHVTSRQPLRSVAQTQTAIDSSQMKQSSAGTLSELLSKNTSVFIKSYGQGSLATISFRGTAASHTAVEWNGININNPMIGQVDFSMLPVWLLDRVSLLHGGSSLAEGGGALGGSIILGSSPGSDKPFYASAMAGVGSFGLWQGMAQVGGGSQKVRVDARYIYEQARNDFEYLNTAIPPFEYMRQANADYRKQSATFDLSTTIGGGHYIDAGGWYASADRNLPPIMSYQGLGRDEKQRDNDIRGYIQWKYYSTNIRSSLTVGTTVADIDYYMASRTDQSSLVNYDTYSRALTLQTKYTLDYDITTNTAFRLLINAQNSAVRTLDRKTDVGYSANRLDVGVSASVHHRFSRLLSGYILLRYETPSEIIPSLGLQIEPIANLLLTINATRNYHRPTLNDLYWLPGGNPELRPEKGYSADLGLKYMYTVGRWKINTAATAYASLIEDWIQWQPGEYRFWTPQNIKTVLSRGIETAATSTYDAKNIRTSLSINYAYTKTTNQQAQSSTDHSRGKQLIYIPLHKGAATLSIDYRFLYAYYTWSYTGERFTTSSGEATRHNLPPYALSDLCLGARLYGVDIAFKINNLLDADYQAILWRPMPRRNYNLLVKYTF